jgi:hypothetical protein
MPKIECFLIVPSLYVYRSLRRYASIVDGDAPCPVVASFHNGQVLIDRVEDSDKTAVIGDNWPHTDPRWPVRCECGYAFQPTDPWQLFLEREYQRVDASEYMTLKTAPAGAMWNAEWFRGYPWCSGPYGRSMMVKLPNGNDWLIDGPASNCTRPNEPHKCWIRHGEPPKLTVNKTGGDTCAAGAGSILSGNYHGFLTDGYLVD